MEGRNPVVNTSWQKKIGEEFPHQPKTREMERSNSAVNPRQEKMVGRNSAVSLSRRNMEGRNPAVNTGRGKMAQEESRHQTETREDGWEAFRRQT
jgi:hypothetical protein